MKKIILILLFLAAFLERTVFDFGPNIELVTLAMLLASVYFGQKEAFWLTLAIMVAGDFVIGNTNIFLFTWSGFFIPVLFVGRFLKSHQSRGIKRVFTAAAAGVSSNLFFYFWTNFGVWLLDSWGMYSRDFSGLMSSYINGLPFLKMQLTGTLIFVPLVFLATESILSLYKRYQGRFGFRIGQL